MALPSGRAIVSAFAGAGASANSAAAIAIAGRGRRRMRRVTLPDIDQVSAIPETSAMASPVAVFANLSERRHPIAAAVRVNWPRAAIRCGDRTSAPAIGFATNIDPRFDIVSGRALAKWSGGQPKRLRTCGRKVIGQAPLELLSVAMTAPTSP